MSGKNSCLQQHLEAILGVNRHVAIPLLWECISAQTAEESEDNSCSASKALECHASSISESVME